MYSMIEILQKDMQSILQSMECMLPFRDFRK